MQTLGTFKVKISKNVKNAIFVFFLIKIIMDSNKLIDFCMSITVLVLIMYALRIWVQEIWRFYHE